MAGRAGRLLSSSPVLVTNTTSQPVPVSVQGTAKVAVQGIPTVLAAQPASGYRINNGATNPVPVKVSNPPSGEVTVMNNGTDPVVTVSEGTGSVNVANNSSSPVPTEVLNSPTVSLSSQPSDFDSTRDMITISDFNASNNYFYIVPSGYTFIIDTVSASASANQQVYYCVLTVEPPGLGQVLNQMWIPMPFAGLNSGIYSNAVTVSAHMVLTSGQVLMTGMDTPYGVNVNSASFMVTGSLVPAGPRALRPASNRKRSK